MGRRTADRIRNAGRIRIAHLSDLHYDGSPELAAALDQLIERVASSAPDLAVVTGDLTADGRPDELDAVHRALRRLAVPRLVIPGNRDLVPSVGAPGEARALPVDADLDDFLALEPVLSLGLESPADADAAATGSPADADSASPLDRWTARFGDPTPVIATDRLHVVGVDSNPRLRSSTLEKAAKAMRRADRGALRVFALHHGLLPVPGRKLRDGDLSHRAGDVLALLLDLEVDLALHGHVHRAHAWRIATGERALVVASAGALVNDGRRDASFLEIDVEGGTLVVRRRSVATGRPATLFEGGLGRRDAAR